MVTPYMKSQRGNSVTTTRLYSGLGRRGYKIDLISLDDPDWQLHLDRYTHTVPYSLVHGFHAFRFSQIANHPCIRELPVLLTTTGTDINYDLIGSKKEQTLATMLKAKKVVVFNQSLGKQIAKIEPRLRSRQVVIPQGVELLPGTSITHKQLGLSPDNVVFVIPSGLRRVKNLDLALDGLERIYPECPQIRLLIVGAAIDTEYTSHIKSRLDKLKWAFYLGEVPHHQMKGILQTSDIVLNTSLAEGQPQGALEAMSLGKPCILTDVPGNQGIINHGCHGFYINTPEELAASALNLIQNPSLQHIMGSAAQLLIHERFSVETELNSYTQLYQELLFKI